MAIRKQQSEPRATGRAVHDSKGYSVWKLNETVHEEFRDTPIIILSGHDAVQHGKLALDAGCNDYLLKPIDFERLDTILLTRVPLPH